MTTDYKDELRLKFSAFSTELKNALQLAAARNQWDKDAWVIQVKMIAYSLDNKVVTENQIAEAYRVPVIG